MATKDWIKKKTRRGMIQYEKGKEFIYLTRIKTINMGNMYSVSGTGLTNDWNFNTKYDAIKFLKKYINSH